MVQSSEINLWFNGLEHLPASLESNSRIELLLIQGHVRCIMRFRSQERPYCHLVASGVSRREAGRQFG